MSTPSHEGKALYPQKKRGSYSAPGGTDAAAEV